MTKRIVLIGGPSTGKTTLLNALRAKGHTCLDEVSREVTKAAQEKGVDQLFLTQPLLFSQMLLDKRIEQFTLAPSLNKDLVFIDRGIPDVTAYMDFIGQEYPENFKKACLDYKYDHIFILPPWQDIHTTDQERYESFDEAVNIQNELIKTYKAFGYSPIEVPKTGVDERVNFILQNLDICR